MFDTIFLIISNWLYQKIFIKLLPEVHIQNVIIKIFESKAEPGYPGLLILYSKLLKFKLIQHKNPHFLHKFYSDIQDDCRMLNKLNVATLQTAILPSQNKKQKNRLIEFPSVALQKSTVLHLDLLAAMNGLILLDYPQ